MNIHKKLYILALLLLALVPAWQAQNKTVTPDEVYFDFKEGDFKIQSYSSFRDYSRNQARETETNKKTFQSYGDQLPKLVYRVLQEDSLNDTTKTVFPNYRTNLKLDVIVNQLNVDLINNGYLVTVKMKYAADVNLKSHFGKSLQKEPIAGSFRFELDYYGRKNFETEFSKQFDESLAKELRSYFETDAVKAILLSSTNPEPAFAKTDEIIQLKANHTREIEDWKSALVTVMDTAGHGSGCIISSDGYVVTNYHVIALASKEDLRVKLSDQSSFKAEVVRYDPETDLALLKIDTTGLKTFSFVNSKGDMIGQNIFVAGTPVDTLLNNSISHGIVSGEREYHSINYLQTDAVINFGNSGGPMLTADGRIAGIVNAKFAGFGIEGIGFAVPADYVFKRLNVTPAAEVVTPQSIPPTIEGGAKKKKK